MRTKNFFKGLAVAAVALVGVFATSCSEEELNVQGNITGDPVTHPDPTVLPDGVANAVISIVDLGDMGVDAKVLATKIVDVTGKGEGFVVECPEFDEQAEYVIPAAQKINVPSLEKGQSLTIPMTFYVVKLTSAFAKVETTNVDWGWDEGYMPFIQAGETVSGMTDAKYKNESDYWKDMTYEYTVKYGLSGVIEDAPQARVAETTEEEVIDAYVQNMIDTDINREEYTNKSTITVYSWGYAEFKLDYYYSKPVYKFTYGNTTKTVTLRDEMGTMCYANAYAIPGHEHAFNHSHAHGGYENAGGGMAE